MRLPIAAVLLSLAAAIVYFQSSGGLLYPSFEQVSGHSFGLAQPVTLAFHLFYHLGIKHLVGNLIPLFVFALLLGLSVAWWEVVGLFLVSGVLSALVFSLLNPASLLIGASSGVSGLMTAGALLRPKLGLVLLIAVPLFVFGVVFPFLDQAAQQSFASMEAQAAALEKQAGVLEQQGKLAEAQVVKAEAGKVAAELETQKASKAREEKAETDFLVHLTGALLGAAFVLWRHQDKLAEALEGLVSSLSKFQPPAN